MWTVEEAIREAIRVLKPSSTDMRECDHFETKQVLNTTEERFLDPGQSVAMWHRLQEPYEWHHSQDRLDQALDYMADSRQNCWFIPETDDGELLHIVFEVKPHFIPKLLGECAHFEYSLVSKNFDWFITETHHNVFMVKMQ